VAGRGGPKTVGPYPICLPLAFADHNLLADVRDEALARFQQHGIGWHHGTPKPNNILWPSSHLLDSQVQCVNALLSLAATPSALLAALQRVVPEATRLIPIEDESPVAFEWIGAEDYLGEARGRSRRRGRFVTSLDALCVVERADGGRTGVGIEWKFTEHYDESIAAVSPRGTDRRARYRPRYEAPTSPFAARPPIDAFLHEPHYQLLRQALLLGAMVEAGEHGIDRAVLLHVVPSKNRALRQTVPEGLRQLGDELGSQEMDTVWRRLLPGPQVRYACATGEGWFAATPALAERYGVLAR
jgi:hypothetical protein